MWQSPGESFELLFKEWKRGRKRRGKEKARRKRRQNRKREAMARGRGGSRDHPGYLATQSLVTIPNQTLILENP